MDNQKINAASKIMILYVIHYANIPLSKNQLTNIILENNLTDFFSFNQFLGELEYSNTISYNEDKDIYLITEEGIKYLSQLGNAMDGNIKQKITKYIDKNKLKLRFERETSAHITKKQTDEYIVTLKAFEADITLIEMNINVPTLEQANTLCNNWKTNANIIFRELITSLSN